MLLGSLLVIALTLALARGQCEDRQLYTGLFFSCQVETIYPTGTPVRVMVQQVGVAGLPEWVSVSQYNSTSPAYIHGTPTRPGALKLQITVLSEVTFDSVSRNLRLTITTPDGEILQEHELYIANFELSEFLTSETLLYFNSTMTLVYSQSLPAATPLVLRVAHPSSPVPPPPAKHGVIVSISPGLGVSSPDSTFCSSSFTQFITNSGFEVDSCSVMNFPRPTSSAPTSTGPPEEERPLPPAGDGDLTLVIILVVGVAILFMFVVGLGCLFFGGRRGRYTVSHKKKSRLSTMHTVSKETSSGPVGAQVHLRDLARPVVRVPAATGGREGDGQGGEQEEGEGEGGERPRSPDTLLEYRDLTDNDTTGSTQDPPPYTYPNISYSSSTIGTI